jgi:transcriptional regulator with GAF, ATPase, and Fis domain
MKYRTLYNKQILNVIYDVTQVLNARVCVQSKLNNVTKIIGDSLDIQSIMLLAMDSTSGMLAPRASYGISKEDLCEAVYKVTDGIVGKVYRHGFPILIQDISVEAEFSDKIKRRNDKQLSFIAVPITHGKEQLGVFAIDKFACNVVSYEAEVNAFKIISAMLASFIYRNNEPYTCFYDATKNTDRDYSNQKNTCSDQDERQLLIETLERTGWVQAKTARALNMTVRQVNYRIMKLGIEVKKI